jgi:hypothetical protein
VKIFVHFFPHILGLRVLRIENITDEEGNILMMADINARWRVHINWAEYFRLREELGKLRKNLGIPQM